MIDEYRKGQSSSKVIAGLTRNLFERALSLFRHTPPFIFTN